MGLVSNVMLMILNYIFQQCQSVLNGHTPNIGHNNQIIGFVKHYKTNNCTRLNLDKTEKLLLGPKNRTQLVPIA